MTETSCPNVAVGTDSQSGSFQSSDGIQCDHCSYAAPGCSIIGCCNLRFSHMPINLKLVFD
jgi:hypothetical protein